MTKKDFIIRSYCEKIMKELNYVQFPDGWISVKLNEKEISIPFWKKKKRK